MTASVGLVALPTPVAANGCTLAQSGVTYLVSSAAGLAEVGTSCPLDAAYRQTANITLSGNWTPIGAIDTPFTGTYDGDGRSITGLGITSEDPTTDVGLFGVTYGAEIADLAVSGTVRGNSRVGGLIGRAIGTTITDSSFTGSVSGDGPPSDDTNSDGNSIGGLIGAVDVPVANRVPLDLVTRVIRSGVATGTGSVKGAQYVGGLVGEVVGGAQVEIDDSHVTGSVSGLETIGSSVGGLVGRGPSGQYFDLDFDLNPIFIATNWGGMIIRDSSMTGTVTARFESGGLIGRWVARDTSSFTSTIKENLMVDTTFTGQVIGTQVGGGQRFGGGFGEGNWVTIRDVTISGSVTNVGNKTGGLAGRLENSTVEGIVVDGISVSSTHDYTGALVGELAESTTVSDVSALGVSISCSPCNGGSGDGGNEIGGLIGEKRNETTVVDAIVTGTITIVGVGRQVGGAIGDARGGPTNVTERVWADVDISLSGEATDIGGFVGGALSGGATFRESVATGSISIAASAAENSAIGGFIGRVDDNYSLVVEDSYARVPIALGGTSGTGESIGGFIGSATFTDGEFGSLSVERSYAAAPISGAGDYDAVGGFVGTLVDTAGATFAASFWDQSLNASSETVGSTGAAAAGQSVDTAAALTGVTPATTAQLTSIGVFDAADWPIIEGWEPPDDNLWGICTLFNDGYAFLLWQSAGVGSDPCLSPEPPGPGPGPRPPVLPVPPEPSSDGGFVAIDPVRVVDTRPSGPVTGGSVVRVPLGPLAPSGARGAVINVTAVTTGVSTAAVRSGYVSVFDCDEPQPVVSNLNYTTDEAVPNAAITGIGRSGEVCVFVSETTDVLVDVMGWFTAGFTPVAPVRLLETRGLGGVPRPVAAGSVTRVPVAGVAGVPRAAVGVALNVTAVNATGAGYLSVYPCGGAVPSTSTLNFAAGSTEANLVVTAVGSTGEVCVFASAGTDVLVDVFGWFDQVFRPVPNTRLLDTRAASPVTAGSVTRVPIAGVGPVAADVRSVAVNVTAVNARAAGYLTVYPCGVSQPNTSNSNYVVGETVAKSTYVGLGAAGDLCIFSSAATDLLVDITGTFTTTVTPA